ncbi:MAG: creatininase family protein [Candidatus Eisenbacteria bacterium]|nr:creatininase family protein [Candidatus Eisenbacteria bacterium]
MLIGEMAWVDVEEYLKKDDRIIVVIGSCEQHGKHLPLSTDSIIPLELAKIVSKKTGVPVLPPLNFGMSLHHMGFPGTVSLAPQTLSQVFTEILSALFTHGFRRIMVLNGHGGNIAPMTSALSVLLNEQKELSIKVFSWWTDDEVKKLEVEFFGEADHHASACETSVVAFLRPELVRLDRAASTREVKGSFYCSGAEFRGKYPFGAVGTDPARARKECGEKVVSAILEKYVRELEDWLHEPRV